MHNAAWSLHTTVRQGLLCEHFIVLVASNQHDQIDGIQLFKSMPTIRLFENKIDLLEGLTVVQRHCTLSRKGKKKNTSERLFWQTKGNTAFIYNCGLTQESLTQQRQSINQQNAWPTRRRGFPKVDRDQSFTLLSIWSSYTDFLFRQRSPLNWSRKNKTADSLWFGKERGKKYSSFPFEFNLTQIQKSQPSYRVH